MKFLSSEFDIVYVCVYAVFWKEVYIRVFFFFFTHLGQEAGNVDGTIDTWPGGPRPGRTATAATTTAVHRIHVLVRPVQMLQISPTYACRLIFSLEFYEKKTTKKSKKQQTRNYLCHSAPPYHPPLFSFTLLSSSILFCPVLLNPILFFPLPTLLSTTLFHFSQPYTPLHILPYTLIYPTLNILPLSLFLSPHLPPYSQSPFTFTPSHPLTYSHILTFLS